ncbi:hypothetical protein ScPMuIL_013866 [Solemya velum]
MSDKQSKNEMTGRGGECDFKRKRNNDRPVDTSSPVIQAFQLFQDELDLKHNKHERLVKMSRDITIESKRIIFLLHRIVGAEDPASILDQALEKLKIVQQTKFHPVAMELQNEDPYQFIRAYTAGVQEYIEALSFYYYLKEKRLITLEEVQRDLFFNGPLVEQDDCKQMKSDTAEVKGDNSMSILITPVDFMLGLADLTGELMRLSINSAGAGDLDVPFSVCDFLKTIQTGFMTFGNLCKEVSKKMYTLKQSLQKVETACYTLQIRGSEVPKHMLADILSTATMSGPSHFAEDSLVDI